MFGDETRHFSIVKLLVKQFSFSTQQKLNLWLAATKLTINVSKTHFMIFYRARMKLNNGRVLLDGKPIEHLKFTKVLGMIIDDKLNFINYITHIKNKKTSKERVY